MPVPAEQQRIYTRLAEIFGPEWAQQNWGQFAEMLNDPSVGAAGVDAFLDRSDEQRRSQGLDTLGATRFQPKQYGVGEGQRQLDAAGITEDVPALQHQLLQLANSPGGAALVQQFQPELERAAEGGFDETEQQALERMLTGAQRQIDARQADPERFAAEQAAESFYDPYKAQASGPAAGGQRNQNLALMNPQHLQDYYQSAVSGASGQDVAGAQLGTNASEDTVGTMMASMDYYRQQAQQVLDDPAASAAEKEQAQQALTEIGPSFWDNFSLTDPGSWLPSSQAQIPELVNAFGPGSILDLPGGFDTKDLTGPELTAALQMGGMQQVYDPRKWLRGGLGAMAARALLPDMARSPAAANIQHADQTASGFGTGGYYAAPTRDQAVENAWQAINAQEMESGQRLSDADRTAMVQQYIDAAAHNQANEGQRIEGFTRNLVEGRPGEQAEALLPQMIGRPSDFAQQARAMDVGRRISPAARGMGQRAVQAYRQANPSAVRSALSRVPGAQMAGRAAGSQLGQMARRLGPTGLVTGAMSAMPIGQDQAAIAASGTGGPSWGTKALGAGAGGLSMLSTEAALPQAMRGVGQLGRFSGISQGIGKGLRAITPQFARGAGGAFSTAMSAGRAAAGPGANMLQRGMAGAKNLATMPGRALQGARAMFNPAARAAAQAAQASKGLGAASQFGRMATLGSGLKNLAGGGILASAGIDAALNAGDAYTSLFGGQRGRQMVQQGNEMLANQAGQRGFWGNVAAAPNVVSQVRTMQGLNEQANQANRGAAGSAQRGGAAGRDIANWQAFDTAAREAGLDPNEYRQIQQEMGGDEDFMNQYLQADPQMQQAHQLYQQTQQDRARRRGTAGFSHTDAQALTDYVNDTGGFWSRAFGGGNEGALRSMSDVYSSADEGMQAKMRNLAQAVQRGDIDASEATHYLNIGASNQKDELLQQMREAGML